jgi:hypothetical protein
MSALPANTDAKADTQALESIVRTGSDWRRRL